MPWAVLNAKAPMVIGRNFKPGFRIRLHQKDLRNALLAAEALKVSLPFTSLAQQMLMALMNNGRGDLDHSAIATFIEDMLHDVGREDADSLLRHDFPNKLRCYIV